jgi:preprotein translocase subunit YajC
MLPFIVAIMVLFWFLLLRPQQQERKRHQAMLAAVKKNDRVITIGGIYGVVTNVHREADEITIKVDEAANVKLRVTLGSIGRVLREESSDGSSST